MFRKLPSRDPMLTNRLAEEAPVVVNAVGSRGAEKGRDQVRLWDPPGHCLSGRLRKGETRLDVLQGRLAAGRKSEGLQLGRPGSKPFLTDQEHTYTLLSQPVKAGVRKGP